MDRKIILTSGFQQFVAHNVLEKSGILNSACKNCDIRLVSCRQVTNKV